MEYIIVGEVINTFGIKGELKVHSLSDFNEIRFQVGNRLFVAYKNNMVEEIIHSYRIHKGNVLISFDEKENINDIEKYVGCELYVSSEDLHELEDGEYYFKDLVGCKVKINDEIVGEVIEVMDMPANAVLRVQLQDRTVLVPFVESFIPVVDLDKKLIVVNAIEGLL
ncbi:MAG: ribosome maturation factor RimM [Erysipelotrichaceae bacterium]|nr:ribosome maturation factor RimM [Erysipelotrichaceae bacterium]